MCAVDEELIEQAIKLVNGGKVRLEDEAVLARDAVTFHHFGNAARQFGDSGQLPWVGPDANISGERQSQRRRIEVEPVAANDARLLHTAHTLRDRWRRHADATA